MKSCLPEHVGYHTVTATSKSVHLKEFASTGNRAVGPLIASSVLCHWAKKSHLEEENFACDLINLVEILSILLKLC